MGVCHGGWYCGNTDVVGGGVLQNISCEMCLITVENKERWLVMCVRKDNVVYVLDHKGSRGPPVQRVKVTEIILPMYTYICTTDMAHGTHDIRHT